MRSVLINDGFHLTQVQLRTGFIVLYQIIEFGVCKRNMSVAAQQSCRVRTRHYTVNSLAQIPTLVLHLRNVWSRKDRSAVLILLSVSKATTHLSFLTELGPTVTN
jgi:hypothetical protein